MFLTTVFIAQKSVWDVSQNTNIFCRGLRSSPRPWALPSFYLFVKHSYLCQKKSKLKFDEKCVINIMWGVKAACKTPMICSLTPPDAGKIRQNILILIKIFRGLCPPPGHAPGPRLGLRPQTPAIAHSAALHATSFAGTDTHHARFAHPAPPTVNCDLRPRWKVYPKVPNNYSYLLNYLIFLNFNSHQFKFVISFSFLNLHHYPFQSW